MNAVFSLQRSSTDAVFAYQFPVTSGAGGYDDKKKKRFITGDSAMLVNGKLVKAMPSLKAKASQEFTEEEMLLLL